MGSTAECALSPISYGAAPFLRVLRTVDDSEVMSSRGRFWRGGSATRSKLVVVLLRLLELLLELLRVCGKRSNGLQSLMNAWLLTLGVRETNSESLGGGRLLRVVRSYFPDPAPVRATVRLQAHVGGN